MSFSIISNLIQFVESSLNVDKEEIIIKRIEIENDCEYILEFKIKDLGYSMRHFEPLNMIPNVNYGDGPYYDLRVFEQAKGFVRL